MLKCLLSCAATIDILHKPGKWQQWTGKTNEHNLQNKGWSSHIWRSGIYKDLKFKTFWAPTWCHKWKIPLPIATSLPVTRGSDSLLVPVCYQPSSLPNLHALLSFLLLFCSVVQILLKMLKRSTDAPVGNSDMKKRKHLMFLHRKSHCWKHFTVV